MHSRELRQAHGAQIFYALLVKPGISQRELCQITGCDKSTVSLVVRRFVELDLLERVESNKSGRRGRPVERLKINEGNGLLIGVHLENQRLMFVASSLSGRHLGNLDVPLPEDPMELGDPVEFAVNDLCAELGHNNEDVWSIGITIPGQVDMNGMLVYSPPLGWRDIDVLGQITARLNGIVAMENDINAAALAEHYLGNAQQVDDFILISTGQGVGGAMFLGGDLYRGKNGYSGEIGHTKIVRDGRTCHCGSRGCLAAYLSDSAMLERAGNVPNIEELSRRAATGDRLVLDMFEETGALLGIAASNMTNALNPSRVVLGGTVVRFWSYIEKVFNQSFRELCLESNFANTETSTSALEMDGVPKGGVAVAIRGLTDSIL